MLFNLFSLIFLFSSSAFAENSCAIQKLSNQAKHTELTEETLSDLFAQSKGCFTVIELWASWCGPCVRIAPAVDQLQKDHPDILFLSISADATKIKAEQFWKQHDPSSYKWRLSAWSSEGLSKEYESIGAQFPGKIPYFVVLDQEGTLLLELTEPKDISAIKKLLPTDREN